MSEVISPPPYYFVSAVCVSYALFSLGVRSLSKYTSKIVATLIQATGVFISPFKIQDAVWLLIVRQILIIWWVGCVVVLNNNYNNTNFHNNYSTNNMLLFWYGFQFLNYAEKFLGNMKDYQKNKLFVEFLLCHVLASFLIVRSAILGYVYEGSIIIIMHDIPDIPFNLSKIMSFLSVNRQGKASKWRNIPNLVILGFALTFVLGRVLLFVLYLFKLYTSIAIPVDVLVALLFVLVLNLNTLPKVIQLVRISLVL